MILNRGGKVGLVVIAFRNQSSICRRELWGRVD
jgi:hypothetical protein